MYPLCNPALYREDGPDWIRLNRAWLPSYLTRLAPLSWLDVDNPVIYGTGTRTESQSKTADGTVTVAVKKIIKFSFELPYNDEEYYQCVRFFEFDLRGTGAVRWLEGSFFGVFDIATAEIDVQANYTMGAAPKIDLTFTYYDN